MHRPRSVKLRAAIVGWRVILSFSVETQPDQVVRDPNSWCGGVRRAPPTWMAVAAGIALGSLLPWPRTAAPAPRPVIDGQLAMAGSETPAAHALGSGHALATSASGATRTHRPPPRPEALALQQPLSPPRIAERALKATLFLRVGTTYGAGILLDANGRVLTCNHVIAGAGPGVPIRVETSSGAGFDATLLDRDPELDVALLRVPGLQGSEPSVASISSVSIGDEVFAMGAPKRMAFSLHRGMVSYVGREFDGVQYLQTDLPTSGGSSGGPVMNVRGDIIAVASFILRDSQGIAFALPIDYALRRFRAHLGDRSQR